MVCPNCGKEIEEGVRFCKYCGTPVFSSVPSGPIPSEGKRREWLATVLLSFFVGGLGVDRFYLGYIWLGLLKLFTLGGCGIWALIDFLLIAFNKIKDVDGNYPVGREGKEWVGYLLIGLMILGGIFWFIGLLFTPFFYNLQ